MKKQTKSNLLISLQTLGIVFVMFFAMAFACDDGSDPLINGKTPNNGGVGGKPTSRGAGRCSTEAEFQNIIQTKFHLNTFGEAYGEYKESEIVFHTFSISAPTGYTSTDAGHLVKVDTAYPVLTDYTTRHYKHDGTRGVNELWEYDWNQVQFMCYINHRNECACDRKKYQASDKRVTPLNE